MHSWYRLTVTFILSPVMEPVSNIVQQYTSSVVHFRRKVLHQL